MAEKTATEWLFEQLWNTDKDKFTWHALLKQSKEMEKQQIIDAWSDVGTDGVTTSEEYYNTTFKSE